MKGRYVSQARYREWYFFVSFQSGREEDDISISKSVAKVKLIVPSKYEIKVEAFGNCPSEVPGETCIGLVTDLATKLFVFLEDFGLHSSDFAHL